MTADTLKESDMNVFTLGTFTENELIKILRP